MDLRDPTVILPITENRVRGSSSDKYVDKLCWYVYIIISVQINTVHANV